MTLDIRTEVQDKNLQEIALQLDWDQDGQLESEDLKLIFGQTAVDQGYATLEDAFLASDFQAEQKAFDDIMASSQRVLAGAFQTQFEGIGAMLPTGAIDENKLFNEHYNEIGGIFTSAYLREYPDFSEYQLIFAADLVACIQEVRIMNALLNRPLTPSLLAREALSIQSKIVEVNKHRRTSYESQLLFVLENRFEWNQPEQVTALETKYGINIKSLGLNPTSDQVGLLDASFASLQRRRPEDWSLLKEILLVESEERVGGLTFLSQDGQIILIGPFQPGLDPAQQTKVKRSVLKRNPYSIATRAYFYTSNIQDYVNYLVAHELGHVLHNQSGNPTNRGYFEKMNEVFGGSDLHELFAEDYAQYFVSDGKCVTKKIGIKKEVPLYDWRLKFFQDNYPLNLNTED